MTMNDVRIRFSADSYIVRCERAVENHEDERLPNRVWSEFLYSFGAKEGSKPTTIFFENITVFNEFLYSFGAKQRSKIMKLNDVRIQFWADSISLAILNSPPRGGELRNF